MTNPPITAVKRVDFRRQKPITSGETNKLTDILKEPSQPEKEMKICNFIAHVHLHTIRHNSWLHSDLFDRKIRINVDDFLLQKLTENIPQQS